MLPSFLGIIYLDFWGRNFLLVFAYTHVQKPSFRDCDHLVFGFFCCFLLVFCFCASIEAEVQPRGAQCMRSHVAWEEANQRQGTRFHIMRELVHPVLQVSPNGTMISLPDHANLPGSPPVLGELLPAQGWHYWEITVSDCGAYKVGICSSTRLESSDLGQKNNSWCLHCSNRTSPAYKVLHNGEMSEIIVTEQPTRIGILLDYNTGRLLFLNAERGQLLSAIKYKFTKAAYPVFVLEQSGFLNLHTGMELPEFVKQS